MANPAGTGTGVIPGPGWSLLRVAALVVLSIVAGGLLGSLVATGLVLLSGPGSGTPSGPGVDGLAVYAVFLGAAAGASCAAVAALGSLCALVIGDHWGTRSAVPRAGLAALGAGVSVALLSLGLTAVEYPLAAPVILVVAALAAALCAGVALYLFERHLRTA